LINQVKALTMIRLIIARKLNENVTKELEIHRHVFIKSYIYNSQVVRVSIYSILWMLLCKSKFLK